VAVTEHHSVIFNGALSDTQNYICKIVKQFICT